MAIVEVAFDLHGLYVRKASENFCPRVKVRRRVNLRILDRLAEDPEEIDDRWAGLDGLVVTIHLERQRPTARLVDEAEVEERERVKVLQGPVFRHFLEERVVGRE